MITIRTEVINREIYPEERRAMEIKRMEAELDEYLTEYNWFKETLHNSCMPADERESRLEQAYDVYVEMSEDLDDFEAR